MIKLTNEDACYIAGFLDGDGCLNAQIVRRNDYQLKFQIRITVTFYQKTRRHWCLLWFKKRLGGYGSVRKRKDGIVSDYTISGSSQVGEVLNVLRPFIRLKRPQRKLLEEIIQKLPTAKDPQTFIELCERVDLFGRLNDSKKRTITSKIVRSVLLPID
jgi:hypothetical protein